MTPSTLRTREVALSALDFVLIRQLLAQSTHSFDSGMRYEWASCFLPDARCEIVGGNGEGVSTFHGREEIRSIVDLSCACLDTHSTRRWINLPLIEGAGTTARVRAYQMLYSPNTNGSCVVEATATIDCSLRKIAGTWRYAEARVAIDDYDSSAWAAGTLEALDGCGCYTPHIDLSGEPNSVQQADVPLNRELILQALAAFIFYMDSGIAPAKLAALFTEDGLWQMYGVDKLYRGGSWHGEPMEPVYRGRAEIEAFNRSTHSQREPWDRHWGHEPLISIEGDIATAVFPYATILAGTGSQVRPMTSGLFRHRLRRIDGAWLIDECSAFIERAPADVAEVVGEASGRYVGGVA